MSKTLRRKIKILKKQRKLNFQNLIFLHDFIKDTKTTDKNILNLLNELREKEKEFSYKLLVYTHMLICKNL